MKSLAMAMVIVAVSLPIVGCQSKDELDTKAPPVANPQKEVPPPGFKKKFMDPPSMGAPPSTDQGK